MTNFYILLGIDQQADLEKIKSAYRRNAKQFHPDTSFCSEAAEKFNEITEAYKTLADAEKRRAYDESLRREKSLPRRAPVEDLIPRRPARYAASGKYGWSPEDLVADVRQASYRRYKTGLPERDMVVELVLSPRQAREGGLIPVVFPALQRCPACSTADMWERLFCTYCHGTGQVRTELRFSLSIPPQTSDGTTVSLSLEDIGLKGVGLHVAVRISPIGY